MTTLSHHHQLRDLLWKYMKPPRPQQVILEVQSMTVPWCCVFVLFVWVLLVWSSLLLTVVGGVVVVLVTAPNFLHGRLCQLPVPAATKANVPSDSETGSLHSTGWPGPRRNSAHCHEGRTVQTPRAGSHEGKCAGRSRVVRKNWKVHTHDQGGSGSMRSIQRPLTHLRW